jgi:broad specificity phosphatase PhoE
MSRQAPNTILYIVRHGETEANTGKIMQGQIDSPLTKNGIAQVKNLAAKIKHVRFKAAFSSDLLRAKRTAEMVLLDRKLAVVTSKALRERHYGRFEGRLKAEYENELKHLLEKRNKLSWKERLNFRLEEDIETDGEIIARFITFVREVAVAYKGKNVLIVTHGGIMRIFLIHLGFITPQQTVSVGNTGYVKIESDGVDFFMKKMEGITILEK